MSRGDLVLPMNVEDQVQYTEAQLPEGTTVTLAVCILIEHVATAPDDCVHLLNPFTD